MTFSLNKENTMTIVKKCFLITSAIFFAGCATSNYSIKPDYDDKSGMLKIDDFNFKKVSEKQDNTLFSNQSTNMTSVRTIYKIEDEKCNNFIFVQMDSHTHWYLYDNISIYLSKQYIKDGAGECKVTEIANLKFFECDPKNGFPVFGARLMQSERYWVASYSAASQRQNGYSRIDALNLGNKQCYDKFYDYLTKKAIAEGHNIKKYPLEFKDMY